MKEYARILEEEIPNTGVPLRGHQCPSLEEANIEQAPVNTPPLMDGNIMACLIQFAQVITTQAQAITAQVNQEVVPRTNQQIVTTASCLKEFTLMNPPTFYGLIWKKTPNSPSMKSIRYIWVWGYPLVKRSS